ncbi:MAG: PEP-CTERM system histidine kinase PrsK [Verrucomicrobia bacterium]|nr:MAG: PEP-CTERM system histidine kinase PrsK [Verrucomicrobiota bacterium]
MIGCVGNDFIARSRKSSAVTSESILAFIAAVLSAALAVAAVLRNRRSGAAWWFGFGMLGLAVDSVLTGICLSLIGLEQLAFWQEWALILKAFLIAIWLGFAVTYSRGDAGESFRSWRILIAIACLLPVAALVGFRGDLIQVLVRPNSTGLWISFSSPGKIVNVAILVGTVLVLMNLERTFRSAVGTMQWRIKFLVLGLAVIFGARIYTRSQALVFSGHYNSLTEVEAIGLLVGCVLLGVGYFRSGFREIDVYPSRAVLHTSITVLLVGGYLFVIGVLAQIVARYGGATTFQLQAFLVLVAITLLAVFLLSEKIRQRAKRFVSRHFSRPQYDFRSVWTQFTQSTSSAIDDPTLCAASAKLISETFNVLSVSVWLFDEEKNKLRLEASTSWARNAVSDDTIEFPAIDPGFAKMRKAFDLEKVKEDWGRTLREITKTQFSEGGNRVGVPLLAGDRYLGLIILADRVNGVPYTVEELELLECIGDQVASSLLNLRLAKEIMLGKELEAFQTISAFFVHDLKNAASTLKLTLQNLPVHFDDPDFRQDTLRSIGATTNRINQIIERLGTLGGKLELRPSAVDLKVLVEQAIENLNGMPGIEFAKEFESLPKFMADSEQLRSVVTNLLLNAREAIGERGRIEVKIGAQDGWAALSVSDDGCGMTPSFLRDSLFRPFKTTKKKGLGIGMFQSKMIIEAHHGSIRVKSDLGKGTTFQVLLPLTSGKS